MNSRLWELWVVDCPDLKKDHVRDHIERNVSKGFVVRIVTADQLGAAEDKMKSWMRFQNAGLNGFGVENLYVPKEGCWDVLEKHMRPAGVVDGPAMTLADLPTLWRDSLRREPGRIIYG